MLDLAVKIFFLYLPFQIALNPVSGVDLASARIFALVVFIAWLISSLKKKKLNLPANLTFLLLVSFIFICVLSCFFAANPGWGIRKFIFILSFFPIFLVVSDRFVSDRKIVSLLNFLLYGALLSALVGIFQFFLQFIFPLDKIYSAWAIIIRPFLGESFSQAVLTNPSWLVNVGGKTLLRATAFFPDPHMLAFYLNMTSLIALGIYFYFKNKNQTEKKYLLIFFVLLFAGLLTFSRGGYLGIISGLIFFALFYFKNQLKNILSSSNSLLIVSTILVGIIIFFAIPNNFSNRLQSSFNPFEGSNAGRIQTWNQSLKVVKNNLIIGTGLGNYPLAIKPSADYREPIYSHNTVLDIAAETGILNALIWISIFIFSIFNALRKYSQKNNFIFLGLASALIAFFAHSLFETPLFSIHIFPLLLLILALNSQNFYEQK